MPTENFSQRGGMRPLSKRVRAYFAPVARVTSTPAVFDPAASPAFPLDTPPPPWIDAGWVLNFQRRSSTAIEALTTGPRGLAQKQFRNDVNASVEFDFLDWGKLQMAISAGCQQMNLLREAESAGPAPSGAAARPAVAVLAGSSASEIVVGASVLSDFSAGDLIVVDSDYQQQTGYVGDIAGAYINDPAEVQFDIDYRRRVSFRVGRVSSKTGAALVLSAPLPGGMPPAESAVQKVIGFVDREGGDFFQEWSALFVVESETGARIFYHYPRLQPRAAASESSREVAGFDAWSLHAALIALPTTDANDSQPVLCYRSFIPASHAAVN
ncbi:MAG TPA: hypothetical protein VMZ25_05675 [Terriglobales bacterium]|nr:hypothetical protein [Terriglobales bacterium]